VTPEGRATPELESARHDWGDAYRRFEREAREPRRAEALRLQLSVVLDELRKRIGSTFTLRELAAEYTRADDWVRQVVSERAATSGWASTLTLVQGAAFHLYARSAVDYAP
jgi:hypothetical protein